MRASGVGLMVAALASCMGGSASNPPIPMLAIDSAEYAGFRAEGQLELKGQAFLANRAGDVKLAAGRVVTLDPATPYARTWFRKYGAEATRFEEQPEDSQFRAARRTAIADAEGRFRFAGLTPGTYLVRTLVTWQDEADSVEQGGVVAALAEVEGFGAEVVVRERYTQESAAGLVVAILTDSELGGRRYRSIGRVTGDVCEPGSEQAARKELLVKAGQKRADAMVHVVCRKRGISLSKNCLSRIECAGEGITWS